MGSHIDRRNQPVSFDPVGLTVVPPRRSGNFDTTPRRRHRCHQRARRKVWFWRESLEDGLYQIGGALIRPSGGSRARYIGNQINFELRWALNLHTTIAVNLAGFFTGGFLKDTGPAGDVAFSNVGIT